MLKDLAFFIVVLFQIKKFCPEVPILIIGNKKDIRCERKALTTSSHDKIKDSNFNGLVDIDEASALACEFTPHKVIECSAKTKEVLLLKRIFNIS